MKKLMSLAVMLSLGLFTLGCGSKTSPPAKKGGAPAPGPAATAPAAPGPAAPAAPAAPEAKGADAKAPAASAAPEKK
jgi:hypothetical protein